MKIKTKYSIDPGTSTHCQSLILPYIQFIYHKPHVQRVVHFVSGLVVYVVFMSRLSYPLTSHLTSHHR